MYFTLEQIVPSSVSHLKSDNMIGTVKAFLQKACLEKTPLSQVLFLLQNG